jgi:hypothetical protein
MTTSRPEPLSLLRECQDRELNTEGIPMVIALVSEIGDVPFAADDAVRAEGARLAGLIDHYRNALVPTARDADMGCTVTVMQAVSYDDFGRDLVL